MDYTKLGTMNPAVFDDRQHLAGLVRDTNHVTALRVGIFGIDLPQYLTRGLAGPPHWQTALRVYPWRSLSLSASPSWHYKCDGFAVVKATTLALVGQVRLSLVG